MTIRVEQVGRHGADAREGEVGQQGPVSGQPHRQDLARPGVHHDPHQRPLAVDGAHHVSFADEHRRPRGHQPDRTHDGRDLVRRQDRDLGHAWNGERRTHDKADRNGARGGSQSHNSLPGG